MNGTHVAWLHGITTLPPTMPNPAAPLFSRLKRHAATGLATMQAALLRARRRRAAAHPVGTIKIVAQFGLTNGIVNGARYQAQTLRRLGYAVELVDVTAAVKRPWRKLAATPGGLFIVHCGGPELPLLAWPLRDVLASGRTIGYFAWESALPPQGWQRAAPLVDEVWTPSPFAAEALAPVFAVPVVVAPHVVDPRGTPRRWRRNEGPLTFLTMADARSSLARKNPLGAIAAFRAAFPHERDVRLIVKLKLHGAPGELERLREAVGGDPRIELLTGVLSREDVEALFSAAHVFVSLHRAEGFGLPLLEAMGLGLAAVATGWSGNLVFMNAGNSLLVEHTVRVGQDEGGVYGTVAWADPDLAHAAAQLHRLHDDPDFLHCLIETGWRDCRTDAQLQRFRAGVASSRLLPVCAVREAEGGAAAAA
ncbi:glycosyltransferase [Burkholderia sp. 22PA0099]|uniref:glycosyltransferase n=1 Tax=Burkholderia sp. 22PA0099 TaxID=3237372 RepID=UPI0039C0EFA6